MKYAHIENGKVTFVGALPDSWRNVSGLRKAAPAELLAAGWKPLYEDGDCNCADGETHDGPELVIEPERIVVRYNKRPLTDAEKSSSIAQIEAEVDRARSALMEAETKLASARSRLSIG